MHQRSGFCVCRGTLPSRDLRGAVFSAPSPTAQCFATATCWTPETDHGPPLLPCHSCSKPQTNLNASLPPLQDKAENNLLGRSISRTLNLGLMAGAILHLFVLGPILSGKRDRARRLGCWPRAEA